MGALFLCLAKGGKGVILLFGSKRTQYRMLLFPNGNINLR